MTIADIRPEATSTPAVTAQSALSSNQLEMMRAFFCYEFEVAELDRESVPTATPEAVAEWVDALASSGLFVASELQTMGQAWLSEPDALVALLVGDVDEIAARRDVAPAPAAVEAGKASYLRAS